jgi:Cu/Ag efflux pump CusA
VAANDQEYLVRVVGRAVDADALGDAVVAVRDGRPILVRQLGEVVVAPKVKRGEGSANGHPAVVMAVLKQPDANTLEVTARIDALLDEMEPELPSGLTSTGACSARPTSSPPPCATSGSRSATARSWSR